MNARETALNVLIVCRKQDGWSNGVLKAHINRNRLDPREAALATRLCYGVLQNRYKLDYYLAQLLTGKLKKLHPVVHDILQLGLYQMYEMDKIPVSAAVNEAVAMTKKYCPGVSNAPSLVNAVLRNADRSRDQLRQPDTLWERYSHPKKLVSLLHAYVGQPRLEPMLQANNAVVPTVVQVNTLRTTTDRLLETLQEQGIKAKKHSWLQDCLELSELGNIERLSAFGDGLFYVQDAAARLSVLCAQIAPGTNVLDCCAAPGGKSFAAAIDMKNTGHIISCDIHPHKIGLLQNGAQRLGLTAIAPQQRDASVFYPPWEGMMDTVIADVPCSGYGIIRKKPDIRYKDPDSMQELPALQLQILGTQARYVRPGGVLLYSTCTLVRKENEGVVERFLKQNADFTLEKLTLPAVFPENTTGMMHLVPGEYDTDGFFICRLRRKQ